MKKILLPVFVLLGLLLSWGSAMGAPATIVPEGKLDDKLVFRVNGVVVAVRPGALIDNCLVTEQGLKCGDQFLEAGQEAKDSVGMFLEAVNKKKSCEELLVYYESETDSLLTRLAVASPTVPALTDSAEAQPDQITSKDVPVLKPISKKVKSAGSTDVPGTYPEGSVRYLSEIDLASMTYDQLQMMRNEIFGRHSYIFTSQALAYHFSAQPWYTPKYSDVTGALSELEKANIELIKLFEGRAKKD